MLKIEKISKLEELHWKVVFEGSEKGESDDFALDLDEISNLPAIPPELMNDLFMTLANEPNYGLSENIKMVISPNGEQMPIQSFGLISFSMLDYPNEKSFILLRLEEGTFHLQAANPKSLAIKLKNEKKRDQLLHQLINEPRKWYFVGFVMHYTPNYTIIYRNHQEELFFSLEGMVNEKERQIPLSWVFDLLWQASTARNYQLTADIMAIEDPNGKRIEEANFLTVHMSIEGNEIGILVKIDGKYAIIIGISPERALTNLSEAEAPIIHLAEALATVPEVFERVKVGLVSRNDPDSQKSTKKYRKKLEDGVKNWIYI